MTLHIIKSNELKTLQPPSAAELDAMLARTIGTDQAGKEVRLGDHLASGQPALVDGEWLLGEELTIDDGAGITRRASASLRFETGVDNTTENPVSYLVALIGDRVVHRSCDVDIRKGIGGPAPVQLIPTKYGPMLARDLRFVGHPDGRREFWLALTPEQTRDETRSTLRESNPEQLQEHEGQLWELVHASATPRAAPQ